MITEIDLSQYYIKKQEIESAFEVEGDAATIIKNAINAKPNLGTSHNDAARGDHNHDGTYLKSYTPPNASTEHAGIVQLNESTNSSVKNQAATPSAVQAVYNLVQEKDVTVEKLNANNTTGGYLATYEIRQGNVLLGKIDIPKDFLIKSGTVKKCEVANTPPGFAKGDKYIEFKINVMEGSENDSFIFVNLKDLVDVYYADEETLHLSDENVFSIKENGIKASHIDSGAIENRHISSNTKIDFSKLNISKENISSLNPPFSSNTHAHGSIDINGVIDDDIQGVYRIVVTNNNREIKTANKIPTANLTLPDGTTAQKGIVQLNDSTESTSTTTAATPNAVRQAYKQASHSHPYISTDAGSVGTSNLARRSVTNDKLKPTSIQNGTNLNNITTPGFYYSYYNADTLKNVPKSPDLNGTYDEAIAFTMVVSGEEEGRILTQTLTYQSDYGNSLKTTQFVRTKNINWSGWVLSACSRPIELYQNENFYLIVNPVGRTATVNIAAQDKNFGSKLTDGKIVRYFTLNGNISASNVQVIPSGYRPHFHTPLSFLAWKSGIVGRVMKDGGIRIAVNTKGEHDIHASATWVY